MRDGQRLVEDNDQHDDRHEKQDAAHDGRPKKVAEIFHLTFVFNRDLMDQTHS